MSDWFDYIIDSIVNIVGHLVQDLWEMAWDFFLLCFSKILELAGWVNGLIVSFLPDFDPSTYWASIPGYVIQFLNYMHIGQCLTIIILAMVARFTLNLLNGIPFVRI